MKKSFFLSVIVILFALYYFLFPLTADKEAVWVPLAALDLAEAEGREIPHSVRPVLIRSEGYTGVLRPDGPSLLNRNDEGRRLYSLSHTFESSGPGQAVLSNRINGRRAFFRLPGIPMIRGEHYLIGDLAAGFLREVDTDGSVLWAWEGVSPITALADAKGAVAFGTLDGEIFLYRKDGKALTITPSFRERDSVVYGLALSPSGDRLALVAGRREQTLLVYERTDPLSYAEIRREPLESRYARPVKMVIPPGEKGAVWVEQPGKVLRFAAEGGFREYPFEGDLLAMAPDEEQELLPILSVVGPGKSRVTLRSVAGRLIVKETLEGIPSHFEWEGNQLMLLMKGEFLLIRKEAY